MFHKLYASFAASCIYPGAEMAAMLALAMVCSNSNIGTIASANIVVRALVVMLELIQFLLH